MRRSSRLPVPPATNMPPLRVSSVSGPIGAATGLRAVQVRGCGHRPGRWKPTWCQPSSRLGVATTRYGAVPVNSTVNPKPAGAGPGSGCRRGGQTRSPPPRRHRQGRARRHENGSVLMGRRAGRRAAGMSPSLLIHTERAGPHFARSSRLRSAADCSPDRPCRRWPGPTALAILALGCRKGSSKGRCRVSPMPKMMCRSATAMRPRVTTTSSMTSSKCCEVAALPGSVVAPISSRSSVSALGGARRPAPSRPAAR